MARLSASSAVMKVWAARLWQSMQSMTRRSPWGGDCPRRGGEDRLRAVGVALLDPGDGGAGLVGGDVLDVAEVGTVNPAQLREGVAAAEMEHDDGLGLGVLFVVGKAGFDQELFADEAGWGVAALADFARGAETADGDSMGGDSR